MTRLSHVISCVTRRHKSALPETDQHSIPSESGTPNSPDTGQASGSDSDPQMEACLTTVDLVSLGVGSCLGTGMYLTAGLVASTMTGPSGVISLLIAGAASVLTGLCYAELAGLCPNTSGSAYMYAYITVGELVAFIIGWGLVVEYVIGTAAGAVALSETLDSLSSGIFSSYMNQAAAVIGLPKLDLLAAVICVLLALLLASGVEMSAKVNNGLNVTNIAVLVFFAIASLALGSSRNWVAGGFFPFGITGVVRAIPTCYFAYIGFDTVAATGAEAKDPCRSVPRSILLSILINCVAYVIVIMALTFDLPFYMLHHDTAMTDVFPRLGFAAGKYIVAVGAVSGEFAATFGSMFPLPRVLAAMAADGLIFRQLGKICPKRHTPVTATLLSGFVAMVMATFFDLELLIELVLIGTLLAYILVTFAVLFMRYVHENPDLDSPDPVSKTGFAEGIKTGLSSDQRQDSSAQVPELTPSSDNTSAYEKIRGSPKEQPKMSRFQNSPSSKHVTFNSSLRMHTNCAAGSGATDPVDTTPANHTSLLEETALLGNSASSPNPKRSSNSSNTSATPHSKESHFKKLDFHPLMDDSSSIDEDESLASDNILFERQLSPDISNKLGGSSIRKYVQDQNPGPKSKKSDLRKLLMENQDGNENRNSLPLWLKLVKDVVDRISVSPPRTLSLLCAIYAVEVVMCIFLSKQWQTMADGSIVSLGFLGFLSTIFVVLVGIISFMPQSLSGDEFRAPLVPALPVFVAFVNIYLMTSLSLLTWLLFGVWMSLGLLVYLLYGAKHSQAGSTPTYTPLPSTQISMILDNNDDIDSDEETALLNN